jgi:hexokinase
MLLVGLIERLHTGAGLAANSDPRNVELSSKHLTRTQIILRDFELKGLAEKRKILQGLCRRVTSHRTAGTRPLQDPQTISQHGLLLAQRHAPG